MKARHLVAALCLGAFLQGCATYTVRSDYDPKADFSKLRTFAWMSPKKQSAELRLHDPRLDQRITRAIEATLQRKGFRPAGKKDKPDFYVGFHTAIQQRIDVWTMNSMYGYPPGWGWNHYYRTSTRQAYTPRMVTYDEGTLVVDIIAGTSKQLIWRGALQARLDDKKRSPEEKAKRIGEAVDKIFADFPPGTTKK